MVGDEAFALAISRMMTSSSSDRYVSKPIRASEAAMNFSVISSNTMGYNSAFSGLIFIVFTSQDKAPVLWYDGRRLVFIRLGAPGQGIQGGGQVSPQEFGTSVGATGNG